VSAVIQVHIHSSQFPEQVRADLLASLRSRQIKHKFLYDSLKQTQKWLALHQAYSPSRTDPDCEATYQQAFESVAASRDHDWSNLLGLGCGGGQKDSKLLETLGRGGKQLCYTPCDVSVEMVLTAARAATERIPGLACYPFVCDLGAAEDLAETIATLPAGQGPRLITFFGMLPNFEPDAALSRLVRLVGPEDTLLLSTNLAPGPDYEQGVRKILPLYDNSLTREWLMLFLTDLGIEAADGELAIAIAEGTGKLKRVEAIFRLVRARSLTVGTEQFFFCAGETVRLFFSYRHTPAMVDKLAKAAGLRVQEQWVTRSGEEGVFVLNRGPDERQQAAV
jgi:L-histidine N-alpha-methyltransferase